MPTPDSAPHPVPDQDVQVGATGLEPLPLDAALRLGAEAASGTEGAGSGAPSVAAALSRSYWEAFSADGEAVAEYVAHATASASSPDELSEANGTPEAETLYATALAQFKLGERDRAAALFASAHAAGDGIRPAAAIAVAICALYEGRADIAARLSKALVDAGLGHPRILLVTGISAARQGDVPLAKRLLAQATRAARRNPLHNEEQHMAQRVLLGLQFGAVPIEVK